LRLERERGLCDQKGAKEKRGVEFRKGIRLLKRGERGFSS